MTHMVILSLLLAVHPTKAQAAYFAEHEKCVAALSEARASAKAGPADQRKAALAAAKQAYRRCEEHAHLVWKYWPDPPPAPSKP